MKVGLNQSFTDSQKAREVGKRHCPKKDGGQMEHRESKKLEACASRRGGPGTPTGPRHNLGSNLAWGLDPIK